MHSRREWLGRAAFGAAFLGLPRPLLARLGATPRPGERRYLDLALASARWVAASGRASEHGMVWPADPAKPESVGLDFYNGMPGVVVFCGELFRATADPTWLRAAEAGAAHLAAELERRSAEQLDAGLYTGLGGLAFTFFALDSLDAGGRYGTLARRAAALLVERAKAAPGGVHWNGSHDIISGNAGIGLLLLDAYRRDGNPAWLDTARRAGTRLLEVGESARGGTMWFPSLTMRRNMPNFSHGTAGIAYFLARLFQETRDERFLAAALSGARYLEAVAVRRDGGTLIHHHDGGGEELFYLSWCHGPPGTARLFLALHEATGDARWLEWVHSLAAGLFATGVPERRAPGFWNNISQCCGNVGVGEFAADLTRRWASPSGAGAVDTRAMIGRVVDDTIARARNDEDGLRWIQAEHRVQPDNVVAQTGFMQGAAGVGVFLLKLDAMEQNRSWQFRLPDSPFGG